MNKLLLSDHKILEAISADLSDILTCRPGVLPMAREELVRNLTAIVGSHPLFDSEVRCDVTDECRQAGEIVITIRVQPRAGDEGWIKTLYREAV